MEAPRVRDSIAITVLAALAVAVVVCGGCSMTGDTTKLIKYDQGSINMHPLPYPVTAITTEAGDTVYSYVMPDGSHKAVEDMGVYGNFTLSNNQNDTIEQTSRGQVQAEVSPVVTGQGSATGGADSSSTDIGGDVVEPPEDVE